MMWKRPSRRCAVSANGGLIISDWSLDVKETLWRAGVLREWRGCLLVRRLDEKEGGTIPPGGNVAYRAVRKAEYSKKLGAVTQFATGG